MGCNSSKPQTTTKPKETPPKAAAPPPPAPVNKDTVKILLTIISAKGLAASDEGGTSDPYCQFTYREKEIKTNVEYKTLAPEWGTKVHLLYNPTKDPTKVTVTVLDYDKTLWDELSGEAGDPDVLGNCEIDLSPAIENPNKVPVEKSVELKGKIATGTLQYSVSGEKVDGTVAAPPPPPPKAVAQKPPEPEATVVLSQKTDCLEIHAVEAKGLRSADPLGQSDPLVNVHWRGKKYSSTHKKKTVNPVWNEMLALPFSDSDPKEVEIDVYDYDFGNSNDFLGNCTIDLSDHKVDQLYYSEVKLSGPKAQGSLIVKTKLCEKKPSWSANPKPKFVKMTF